MIKISWITNRGLVRAKNEDALLIDDKIIQEELMTQAQITTKTQDRLILCVADGLGGHTSGEIASRLTLQTIVEYKPSNEEEIKKILTEAHYKIIQYATANPHCYGLGTVIAGVLIEDTKLLAFNVGDCRLYRFQHNILEQLTKDHSYVQELIDANAISEEEAQYHPARNIVTESIGGIMDYRQIDVRFYRQVLEKDAIYLLTSDGLFDVLTKNEIQQHLGNDLQKSLEELLKSTFSKGATDNISMIAFSYED